MIRTMLAFLVLLFFILLGFPIFMSTFITVIISIVTMDIPLSLMIIHMFGSINSSSPMTIPFFVLMGNIIMKVQIADKLADLANATAGQLKGGLGYVNILTSMLFGGIQGSDAVDASAIGGMLIPAMEKQGYDKDYTVAVTAGLPMLSPIIPPSIAMILYSFYTETPVTKLFSGGLVPGILIGIMQCGVNYVSYRRRGYDIPTTRSSMIHLIKTSWKSLGALIMPLIILLDIVFDIVTPIESGVLAIAYGLIYGLFASRKLKVEDLPKIIVGSVATTTVVFMTISAAGVLVNVLVRMQLQQEVLNLAANTLGSPCLTTLFLVIVLMILGRFLDPTIFITIFAGIVVSVGGTFGFDPIHYGVIMVTVIQIGAVTSPAETSPFIACGVAGLPLEKSTKPLIPYILMIPAAIVLIILVPGIVIFLLGLMR